MEFGVQSFGFWGFLGIRALGLQFAVQESRFRVQGSGSRFRVKVQDSDFRVKVQESRFRVKP